MNDLSKIFVGLGLLCSVLSAGADVKVFVTNQGSDSVTIFSFDGKFKLLREVQVGKAPAGIALSTVNREAYISNTESSEISVIDVDSLEVKKTIDLNGSSLGVAVSPDGQHVYSLAATAGAIMRWDRSCTGDNHTRCRHKNIIPFAWCLTNHVAVFAEILWIGARF